MQQYKASFRDPEGFVYIENKQFYRQINPEGFQNYKLLMQSGLYNELVANKLLIPHEEMDAQKEKIIIKPTVIPFISYPYEWCFSQLKDAAILTLEIQRIALEHNMTLKDATAYNVQFYNGQPIFIDTLSFEKLNPEIPWKAYKQYCEHFLGPLALMAHRDIRLNKNLAHYIDGLPLDFIKNLLPFKTKFNIGLYLHLHLHAHFQKNFSNYRKHASLRTSLFKLKALRDHLYSTTLKIQIKKTNSVWGEYYSFTNYDQISFNHKKILVDEFIQWIKPTTLIDLGANDGTFTRLASERNINSIACDFDPIAVENNYLKMKKNSEKNLLPLLQDLTNPSSSIGWHHTERDSFLTRMHTDCVLVLALIHHLAISNNLPFEYIARFLSELGESLIIEFIPKTDSKVMKLLATRKDIFSNYSIDHFEETFKQFFEIVKKEKIRNSERILYLMKTKES